MQRYALSQPRRRSCMGAPALQGFRGKADVFKGEGFRVWVLALCCCFVCGSWIWRFSLFKDSGSSARVYEHSGLDLASHLEEVPPQP